jgi:hypothetical protein
MKKLLAFLLTILIMIYFSATAPNVNTHRIYRLINNGEVIIFPKDKYDACISASEPVMNKIRVYCYLGNLRAYDAMVDSFEIIK